MKVYYVIKSLMAQKGLNAIKVLSIGAGLFACCILFAAISNVTGAETEYRDHRSLYKVTRLIIVNGETRGSIPRVVYPLAGALKEVRPDIFEGVTVMMDHGIMQASRSESDMTHEATIGVIDTAFFEVTGIKVLRGNPRKDMLVNDAAYISDKMAKKIFGDDDPIGQPIIIQRSNDRFNMTVRGIFRAMDEMTSARNDIFVPIYSPTAGFTPHPRQNLWTTNRRFYSYLRINKNSGAGETEVNRIIDMVVRQNLPEEETEHTAYKAMPVHKLGMESSNLNTTVVIFGSIAVMILLLTSFNYVLVTIASISRRAKSIGIHRCAGAGNQTITSMFLWETAIILAAATIVMILLIVLFQPLIQNWFNMTPARFLAPRQLVAIISALAFFFVTGGLLPGRLMSRIPVTQVFRRFTESNSVWKRGLLFIQIMLVTVISGLMLMTNGQYRAQKSFDRGFSFDRIVTVDLRTPLERDVTLSSLLSQPYVESVSMALSNPVRGYGNVEVLNDNKEVIFTTWHNIADENHLKVWDIPIIAGTAPIRENEALVTPEFARVMHWDNDITGRTVNMKGTKYPILITGVTGEIYGNDHEKLPILTVYGTDDRLFYLEIKLKEPVKENYDRLVNYMEETYPNVPMHITSPEENAERLYGNEREMRNCLLMITIIVMMMSALALIGLTRDEIQRRSKEIAIRKVNGARRADILKLIGADIWKIVIPAAIIGTALTWIVGKIWLSSDSISNLLEHPLPYYIAAATGVIVLVTICVIGITWHEAGENPSQQLRNE